MADDTQVTALVSGHVQGVGFRDFVRRRAADLGLRGRASNLADGRVEVVAEGDRSAAETLIAALRGGESPGRVDDVQVQWGDAEGLPAGFDGQ